MTEYHFTGASIATRKRIRLVAGDAFDGPFKVGLGVKLLAFSEFDAATIASTWNTTADPFFTPIRATAGEGYVDFLHNNAGEDFRLTVKTLDTDGVTYTDNPLSSAVFRLSFQNGPTAGTFTLTFMGQTTEAITFDIDNAEDMAEDIRQALVALSNVQNGDVVVRVVEDSDPAEFDIDFSTGQFAGLELSTEDFTVDADLLEGATQQTIAVTGIQNGSIGQNEIHRLSLDVSEVEVIGNEKQRFRLLGSPTGGTFELNIPTIDSVTLPFNATTSQTHAQIAEIIGIDNVRVTGGRLPNNWQTIEFRGEYAGLNIPEITIDATNLTTGTEPEVQITTVVNGNAGSDPVINLTSVQNGSAPGPATTIVNANGFWSTGNYSASDTVPTFPSTTYNGVTINESYMRVGVIDFSSLDTQIYDLRTGCRYAISTSTKNAWAANGGPYAGQKLLLKIQSLGADLDHGFRVWGYKRSGNQLLEYTKRTQVYSGSQINQTTFTNRTTAFVDVAYDAGWGVNDVIEIDITSIVQELWDAGPSGVLQFYRYIDISLTSIPSEISDIVDGEDKTIRFNSGLGQVQAEVVSLTSGTPEIQKWQITGASDGSISLDVDGDVIGPFAYPENWTATDIQEALQDDYAGTVVTGSSAAGYTVTFPSSFGNVPTAIVFNNSLTPSNLPVDEVVDIELTGFPISGDVSLDIGSDSFGPFNYNSTADDIVDAVQVLYPGVTGSFGPWPTEKIRLTFPGSFGDIDDITEENTLTGASLSGQIETMQNGGTQTVSSISGGQLDLGFRKDEDDTVQWVTGIPYNASASTLQSMINAVLGANSVSVSGGPLDIASLDVEFTGNDWDNYNVQITQFRTAFTGPAEGSYTSDVIRQARSPEALTNVYDFEIVPGRNTPGLNRALNWNQDIGDCNWGQFTIVVDGSTVLKSRFRWADATAADIQNAINEIFGKDVCRVYQVSHSQLYGRVTSEYLGGNSEQAWYSRDVYRIVFINEYAERGSIESFIFAIPETVGEGNDPITPAAYLDGSAVVVTDNDDLFPESYRTYALFALAQAEATPLAKWEITEAEIDGTILEFQYQLVTQYAKDDIYEAVTIGSSDPLAFRIDRAVQAEIHPEMEILFDWCLRNDSDISQGDADKFLTILGSTYPSVRIPWDASTEQIKSALISAFPFMDGNIEVVGSLFNSWLPYDATFGDPLIIRNTLKVRFINRLERNPFDRFYLNASVFVGTRDNQSDTGGEGTDEAVQFQIPLLYNFVSEMPIPPIGNERQRLTIDTETDTQLYLGFDGQYVAVALTDSAATIQTKLNSLSTLGSLPNPANSQNKTLLYPSFARSVSVFGGQLQNGIEIEFSGNGFQGVTVSPVVAAIDESDVFGLEVIQEGEIEQSEIQRIGPINARRGGFTITLDDETTSTIDVEDIEASDIETALEALTSLDPEDVAVTGNAQSGFVVTFDSLLANLPLMSTTVTSELDNGQATLELERSGGTAGGIILQNTNPGAGPKYWNVPENWTPNGVPGSHDKAIIELGRQAIQYGIDQQSQIVVLNIAESRFVYYDRVVRFVDGQLVALHAYDGIENVVPDGLTDGAYYYIVNATNSGEFQLSETLDGEPIEINDAGLGSFYLQVQDLDVEVYSRFQGGAIGLAPTRNGDPEYLPQYLAAGFSYLDIGVAEGDGLSTGNFNVLPYSAGVYDDGTDVNKVIVRQSSTASGVVPAIKLLFDNATSGELTQLDGDVGLAFHPYETSVLQRIDVTGGTLKIGEIDIPEGNFTRGPNAEVTLLRGTIGGTISLG